MIWVDSLFCMITNFPISLAVLSFVLLKFTSALCAILCPSVLVMLSECCNSKSQRRIRYNTEIIKSMRSRTSENYTQEYFRSNSLGGFKHKSSTGSIGFNHTNEVNETVESTK